MLLGGGFSSTRGWFGGIERWKCKKVAHTKISPFVTSRRCDTLQSPTRLYIEQRDSIESGKEESPAFAFYIRIAWPPEVTVGEESKSLSLSRVSNM